MHKLLSRQLRQTLQALAGDVPPALRDLLAAVDAAYREADEDRLLLERSLELTGQELLEKNKALRAENAALEKARAEARKSEQNFRSLIEQGPDLILVHRSGTVIYVNEPFCRFLGRAQDEMLDRQVLAFIQAEQHGEAELRATRVAHGESTALAEFGFIHRNGSIVFAELVGMSVEFDGARANMLVARDVSERRQLQERLALADRMASLGTLAAGVAHEINNPLTFVLANVDFVREEIAAGSAHDPAEVDDALTAIREGAERVRSIVRDLKAFTRSEEKAGVPVDLDQVLRTSVSMTQHEFRHRAELRVELGDLPTVRGSPSRLGQVFVNLLVNAAHAIPPGHVQDNRITLRARTEPSRVVVEVVDTGSGIPLEVQKRIFDPFFTTKPVGVGTGLGLSICLSIVRGVGGDIELDSRVGVGTTFRVLLPLATAALEAEHREPPTPELRSRRRVLIVDDEPQLARAMKRRLGNDHWVTTISRPCEALELLARETFDVILCDLMMPEMTGKELYEEMERRFPEAARRTVMMSGGASAPELRGFLERFGNRLDKPVDFDELRTVIHRVGSAE